MDTGKLVERLYCTYPPNPGSVWFEPKYTGGVPSIPPPPPPYIRIETGPPTVVRIDPVTSFPVSGNGGFIDMVEMLYDEITGTILNT